MAQELSSFISQALFLYRPKGFYPAMPWSQGISEYPCRTAQGCIGSYEQLMKEIAAEVSSPSLLFSHTSLSSEATSASSSLSSGGEFTQAL